jgi:hypothetical protein
MSCLALLAIFALLASHFVVARKSRPLSLPARCAFRVLNAQRARIKRGWPIRNGEFNLKSEDFSSLARCAIGIPIAQRARAIYNANVTSSAW